MCHVGYASKCYLAMLGLSNTSAILRVHMDLLLKEGNYMYTWSILRSVLSVLNSSCSV